MHNKGKFSIKQMILLFFLLCGQFSVNAKNNNIVDSLVKPSPVKTQLKSSAIFAGRGDGITTCPVTGEKILIKKFKFEQYGRTVYFCCHGCLNAAKKAPDKFVKPTVTEQNQAVKSFLAKAQAVDEAEYCNE
jgi:YHS domain-containing protein